MARPAKPQTEAQRIERFFKHVKKTNTCWLWTASTYPNGYGVFFFNNHEHEGAHRFAWKLMHGTIPQGMNVEQTCAERRCVNPDHLMLKPRGAKLTAEDVQEIRRLYATGRYTPGRLSRYFHVEPETIRAIINQKTWQASDEAAKLSPP